MIDHTVLARTTVREHEIQLLAGNERVLSRTKTFVNERVPACGPNHFFAATFGVTRTRRYLTTLTEIDPVADLERIPGLSDTWKSLSETLDSTGITSDVVRMTGLYLLMFRNTLGEQGAHSDRVFESSDQSWLITPPMALVYLFTADTPLMNETIFDVIFKHAPDEQLARFVSLYGAEIDRGRKSYVNRTGRFDVIDKPAASAPAVPEPKPEPRPQPEQQPEQQLECEAALTDDTNVWINGILVNRRDLAVFETMRNFSENETANILMIGPSGCGKTSIPLAYAQYTGMDSIRMNCAAVRDPEEWYGYREAVNGSTEFVPTEFTEKVRNGNVIVVLDEFNRIEPWLHNALLPLLDHARRTVIHNEEIVCGPHTIFVATMNVGARFTGTFVLDAALLNRFDAVINVSYLPEEEEVKLLEERAKVTHETAQQIVNVLTKFRNHNDVIGYGLDVSTRSSLKIAKLVAGGLIDTRTAIGYVIMNVIDDAALLKSLNDLVIATLE